jgi:hypothetical protein
LRQIGASPSKRRFSNRSKLASRSVSQSHSGKLAISSTILASKRFQIFELPAAAGARIRSTRHNLPLLHRRIRLRQRSASRAEYPLKIL